MPIHVGLRTSRFESLVEIFLFDSDNMNRFVTFSASRSTSSSAASRAVSRAVSNLQLVERSVPPGLSGVIYEGQSLVRFLELFAGERFA
jgi:hypothetical protein